MRNAFELWLGQEVLVQLGFGPIKVSLRGMLLRDQGETLLIRPEAGADLKIAKTKVLAIEEVERCSQIPPWRALLMSFIKNSSDPDIQPTLKTERKGVFSMDKPIPILVVSSEFKNRYALKDLLDREGRRAICASTVSESEELLARQEIGLVFCDRALTDGTYRDVLVIIRSLRRNVRLVVTSRLADWDEYLEALNDGAFDLIASPSQTADIVRVLDQARCEDQRTSAPVTSGKSHTVSAGSLA